MKIHTSDLPCVGKKVSFTTSQNSMMVLIIYHSGKHELHFFQDADDDQPDFMLRLSSEEIRQIGSHLLGTVFDDEPEDITVERLKLMRRKMMLEWIDITKRSPVSGMTIGEVIQQKPVELSLIGVFRGDEEFLAPDEDLQIKAGDTLMIIGNKEAIVEFEHFCEKVFEL